MTGRIWNRQMESFILFQSTTPAECLVTFRTGKWLLYCVDPFMIFKSQLPVNDISHLEHANGVFMLFQSTTSAERLVTFPTGKWLLYCGSFHDFESTTIRKWPSRTTAFMQNLRL